MTTYKQRQIVLVPIPFIDQDVEKKRPAVVLSSFAFNKRHNKCIMAAVSSAVRNDLETDEILIRGAELDVAGLPKESIVKAGTIFTIDSSRVIRLMGELTPATFTKVVHCLQQILGAR